MTPCKPCKGCMQMLEGGVQALWELTNFHPEVLPPVPPNLDSWEKMHRFLVETVGQLRVRERTSD
jgi:hypothetical protein